MNCFDWTFFGKCGYGYQKSHRSLHVLLHYFVKLLGSMQFEPVPVQTTSRITHFAKSSFLRNSNDVIVSTLETRHSTRLCDISIKCNPDQMKTTWDTTQINFLNTQYITILLVPILPVTTLLVTILPCDHFTCDHITQWPYYLWLIYLVTKLLWPYYRRPNYRAPARQWWCDQAGRRKCWRRLLALCRRTLHST